MSTDDDSKTSSVQVTNIHDPFPSIDLSWVTKHDLSDSYASTELQIYVSESIQKILKNTIVLLQEYVSPLYDTDYAIDISNTLVIDTLEQQAEIFILQLINKIDPSGDITPDAEPHIKRMIALIFPQALVDGVYARIVGKFTRELDVQNAIMFRIFEVSPLGKFLPPV